MSVPNNVQTLSRHGSFDRDAESLDENDVWTDGNDVKHDGRSPLNMNDPLNIDDGKIHHYQGQDQCVRDDDPSTADGDEDEFDNEKTKF